MTPSRREIAWALSVIGLMLLISGVQPHDRFTWFLEIAPVLIMVPILAVLWRHVPLTRLAAWLLVVHAIILSVGGHYTYAEVPLGYWMQDWFGFARNHYDRIGHLTQGFVPAILTRELLIRLVPLRRGGWLVLLTTAVCLAFSACYELIEWWTAVFTGDASQAFLGTQGDVWDTQWDMFLALVGALLAQLTLHRIHDRQIEGLPARRFDGTWSMTGR
jgi:putative membrane protein